MKIKKFFKYTAASLAGILLSLAMPLSSVFAAGPGVTITSPTANQQTGKNIVVKGNTTANTSVRVYFDGILAGIVTSDASGDWQYSLFNVSEGNHTFAAEVDELGKVYFATTSGGSSMLNSYDVPSGTLNDIPNFPTQDGSAFTNGPVSPDGSTMFLSGYPYTDGYLSKVDIASGAISPVTGLPGSVITSIGSFSPDGSKYFVPELGGTGDVYVVDVASNTITDTIHINSTDTLNYSEQIDGKIYVSDFSDGHIYVINPSDNSMTDFDPGCTAGSVFGGNDNSHFWIGCQDGSALKIDTATRSTLQTISTLVAPGAPSISEPKNSNKVYINDGVGGSTIYVYDTDTGSLLDSIDISPNNVSLIRASNDGSNIFAPMSAGASQMMVINTADDSTSLVSTSGTSPVAYQAPNSVANDTVNFSVVSGGQSGGSTGAGNNTGTSTGNTSDTNSSKGGKGLADTGANTYWFVAAALTMLGAGLAGLTVRRKHTIRL